MEDVIHHNSAGGYLLLAIQVGISGFLMWYVIRRARYELNKACLPTEYDAMYKQLTTDQRSLHLFGGKVGGNEEEQKKLPSAFDEVIAKHEHMKKQGHKRAQSASAVLYAFEKSKEDAI